VAKWLTGSKYHLGGDWGQLRLGALDGGGDR